jgi:hypothetical protein
MIMNDAAAPAFPAVLKKERREEGDGEDVFCCSCMGYLLNRSHSIEEWLAFK